MNIQVSFKHIPHSDSLEAYAKEKSTKINKFFNGQFHVTWTLEKVHGEFVSHCHTVGSHVDMFAEGRADDAYASVDFAVSKLEKQLQKHKEVVTQH